MKLFWILFTFFNVSSSAKTVLCTGYISVFVDLSSVCDGLRLDCPLGSDESRSECERPEWRDRPCGPGLTRCTGQRPGQCYPQEGECDGVFDCIDRSDEGDDACAGKANETEVIEKKPEAKKTEEKQQEDSTLWAFFVFIFLIPITWVLRQFVIEWFVNMHFKAQIMERKELAETSLMKEENMKDIVEFLREVLPRVDKLTTYGDTIDDAEIASLSQVYNQIHNSLAWQDNVRVVVGLGNIFFDAEEFKIDQYHVVLHALEKIHHKGDELETNFCLKHIFGNSITSRILWSSEEPCIRQT